MAYGPNFILNVTSTASKEGPGTPKTQGNNDNTGDTWAGASTDSPPQWWYGDVGSGVTKVLAKVTIYPYYDANGGMLRNAKIQGSNDASGWTDLITITDFPNNADPQDFTTTPGSAYRYFRVYIESNWRTVGVYCGFNEVRMYEEVADVTTAGRMTLLGVGT